MKTLAEQAGNAAQLAEECKELNKQNANMSKELAGVGEKFKEEQLKRKNQKPFGLFNLMICRYLR